MSYAIRLQERYDGIATSLDGMFVAMTSTTPAKGAPVTNDVEKALRFRCRKDVVRYLEDADGCGEIGAANADRETRVQRLIGTYSLAVVRLRPPRAPRDIAALER